MYGIEKYVDHLRLQNPSQGEHKQVQFQITPLSTKFAFVEKRLLRAERE